jgi:phospholipase/carboxylesterase
MTEPPDPLVARVREPQADPEGLLVLLHGRGADENDLFPLFDLLDPRRRLLGVTPRGPLSLPPGGAHWYALGGIPTPDPGTFWSTFELVAAWLEDLRSSTGIEPARTVIGGFSQGCVISYALTFARGRPSYAALVAFSGFLPEVDGLDLVLEGRTGFRVAMGHGVFDPVIPVDWSRRARAALEAAGAEVFYRESPMSHAVDPGFVREVGSWLHRGVPDAP